MTTQVKTTDDLLSYLVSQASSGQKNWFGFAQQRLTGIKFSGIAIAETLAQVFNSSKSKGVGVAPDCA